jgi:hypothetical protein
MQQITTNMQQQSMIDSLVPNKRLTQIRTQLTLDINHLLNGDVNCILCDYFDVREDVWMSCTKNNRIPKELHLMKINIGRHGYYYMIHYDRFLEECLNVTHETIQQQVKLFVDANSPDPIVITDRSSVENDIISMIQCIMNTLQNNTTTNIHSVTFDSTIDTCVLNGWLLQYPYIYVHTKNRVQNNLCMEQLYVIKTPTRQFTVPVSLVAKSDINHHPQQQLSTVQVSCVRL